jgi:hypothetical protein
VLAASWLHVDHADTMERLAAAADLHPLVIKTFADTRPQTVRRGL